MVVGAEPAVKWVTYVTASHGLHGISSGGNRGTCRSRLLTV